jgi:hypothetical protein
MAAFEPCACTCPGDELSSDQIGQQFGAGLVVKVFGGLGGFISRLPWRALL